MKNWIIFLGFIVIILSGIFLNKYYENKRIEEYECTMTPCSDSPVRILTKEEVEAQEKERRLKEEYISEEDRIKIDEYNFEQLEKVKSVLDGLDKNSYSFNNLKEFNKKFNQNITPIKNCYFFSSKNGKEAYIFGFKIYSNKYINKYFYSYKGKYIEELKKEYGDDYFNQVYIYPKYDLNKEYICDGGSNCDWDSTLHSFAQTISNPCED